jgi:pSer/pThr/pTyr-binding forkhead associated (FHA) protein
MASNQARPSPGHRAPEPPADGTRLETDEEIRKAILALRARSANKQPAAAPGGQARASATPAPVEAQVERPVLRPPMALLCILDDGKSTGEWVRLRADATAIGRSEGDVRIPHDALISSKHAQVVRQRTPEGYRWVLVDLHSTNGTFVRIGSTILRDENEVLIGGGRYRFEVGPSRAPVEAPVPVNQATQAWAGSLPGQALVPSLVELSPTGPLGRIPLTQAEYWIGRDARSCAISRPHDLFASPRHARLYRDARGQWQIESNKSPNGLWLRLVEPMLLTRTCQFRVGEQRFIFRVS